jgi:protein SMG6
LGSNGGTNRALFNPDERVQASAVSVERIRGEDAVERRRTRSKRDVVEIADLGAGRAKESKESLDSEEGGRPGSRSSKEGKHRRRREGERRRGEDREAGGAAVSQAASLGGMSSRQLFDPRRDDPVRFSHGSNNRKSTASDTRSLAPSTISIASSAPSINESNPVQDANSFMAQLRRAYKDIQDLEGKLQDEHRAALAAAVRDEEADGGVRIQGSAKKSDDNYWVRLAMGHKQ